MCGCCRLRKFKRGSGSQGDGIEKLSEAVDQAFRDVIYANCAGCIRHLCVWGSQPEQEGAERVNRLTDGVFRHRRFDVAALVASAILRRRAWYVFLALCWNHSFALPLPSAPSPLLFIHFRPQQEVNPIIALWTRGGLGEVG